MLEEREGREVTKEKWMDSVKYDMCKESVSMEEKSNMGKWKRMTSNGSRAGE